jgi:hypothetical protein
MLYPGVKIAPVGTCVVVDADPLARHRIGLTLDAIRHPIQITSAATLSSVNGEAIERIKIQVLTLSKWLPTTWGQRRWEFLGDDPRLSYPPPSLEEAGLFELRKGIISVLDRVCSALLAAQEGACSHARELRIEDTPRAYDIAQIAAHPQAWASEESVIATSSDPRRFESLARGFWDNLESGIWDDRFAGTGIKYDQRVAAWRNMLLVREAPEMHCRLLTFLEHLQRTGKMIEQAAN